MRDERERQKKEEEEEEEQSYRHKDRHKKTWPITRDLVSFWQKSLHFSLSLSEAWHQYWMHQILQKRSSSWGQASDIAEEKEEKELWRGWSEWRKCWGDRWRQQCTPGIRWSICCRAKLRARKWIVCGSTPSAMAVGSFPTMPSRRLWKWEEMGVPWWSPRNLPPRSISRGCPGTWRSSSCELVSQRMDFSPSCLTPSLASALLATFSCRSLCWRLMLACCWWIGSLADVSILARPGTLSSTEAQTTSSWKKKLKRKNLQKTLMQDLKLKNLVVGLLHLFWHWILQVDLKFKDLVMGLLHLLCHWILQVDLEEANHSCGRDTVAADPDPANLYCWIVCTWRMG